MKYLLVGDVHATANDLDDCRALMDLVVETAKDNEAKIIFLGDLYDTHGIISSEVLKFWHDTFARLAILSIPSVSLVGNHDKVMSGNSGAHSLISHVKDTLVVDKGMIIDGIAFVPYVHDKEEFVKTCNSLDSDTLICHQSFEGAQFENGFFDPTGVDQALIKQKKVIAGHIHKPAILEKVRYIGSPRWRTKSDANIDKEIVLVDLDDPLATEWQYPTSTVCRKVHAFEDRKESQPDFTNVKPKDRVYVDIYGDEAYIKTRKEELSQSGYRIRTFKDQSTSVSTIKESDGIGKAFNKWINIFKPKNGTPTDILKKIIQERVNL